MHAVTTWFTENPSADTYEVQDGARAGEIPDGANSLVLWQFLRATFSAIMEIKEQKGFEWISGMKDELDLEDVERGVEAVEDAYGPALRGLEIPEQMDIDHA